MDEVQGGCSDKALRIVSELREVALVGIAELAGGVEHRDHIGGAFGNTAKAVGLDHVYTNDPDAQRRAAALYDYRKKIGRAAAKIQLPATKMGDFPESFPAISSDAPNSGMAGPV